jgi:hypothetical protein
MQLLNLSDDLKANFRSWEHDSDNEADTNSLISALSVRHPNVPYETIVQWATHWTGYEPTSDME